MFYLIEGPVLQSNRAHVCIVKCLEKDNRSECARINMNLSTVSISELLEVMANTDNLTEKITFDVMHHKSEHAVS